MLIEVQKGNETLPMTVEHNCASLEQEQPYWVSCEAMSVQHVSDHTLYWLPFRQELYMPMEVYQNMLGGICGPQEV